MTALPHPRVAVLVELSSAHGRGLIRGIAHYARRHTDWSLHLEESGPLRATPLWLTVWRGEGIIARLETPAITRAVLAKKVPLVNVSGYTTARRACQVDLDDRGVCELALDYFRQRSYRHFAYCGNPRYEWSVRRQELFADCVARAGGSFAAFPLTDHPRSLPRLSAWLTALPKPCAILAGNDLCGCRLLEVCAGAGLAVPGEIAVLGVDDDPLLCTFCQPQLSSVVPDTEGIGYLAAQTLHALMRGEPAPANPQLVRPLSVQSRASTDDTAVDQWHVRQALRFIQGNATRAISVADVVVQARSSRRFLEKQFKAVVGRPIHAEILRVRLEAAKNLLQTTQLPLKSVAERSGFRRADYLSSVFQNRLGLSPTQYRTRAT